MDRGERQEAGALPSFSWRPSRLEGAASGDESTLAYQGQGVLTHKGRTHMAAPAILSWNQLAKGLSEFREILLFIRDQERQGLWNRKPRHE